MPPENDAVWGLIRDWDLPSFPAPKAWYARKMTSVDFLFRLENDLLLFKGNARGLIFAYRQWLYLCATEGRRMQGSDLIGKAEALHREAGDNWAALVAALPAGALAGEPARRGPENDVEYQQTLERLAATWPEGDRQARSWPATWRYGLDRKIGRLGLASVALLGTGGVALSLIDVGPVGRTVLAGACLAGMLGLIVYIVVKDNLSPFVSDDSHY